MLLEDIQLNKVEILEEATATKPMKIRGVFQRAEEPNKNKRIYPRTVLEASIEALKPTMQSRQLLGELDHPAEGVVKLQNASHLITNLSWKGNDMIGEAEILNTPAGKIAQALIRDGVQIGISSRGQGSLSEANSEGYAKVNEDYRMITFDLVADPSTKGAFPSLAESFIRNSIIPVIGEEKLVKAIKKAAREKSPVILDEDSSIKVNTKTNMEAINERYNLIEGSLGAKRLARRSRQAGSVERSMKKLGKQDYKSGNIEQDEPQPTLYDKTISKGSAASRKARDPYTKAKDVQSSIDKARSNFSKAKKLRHLKSSGISKVMRDKKKSLRMQEGSISIKRARRAARKGDMSVFKRLNMKDDVKAQDPKANLKRATKNIQKAGIKKKGFKALGETTMKLRKLNLKEGSLGLKRVQRALAAGEKKPEAEQGASQKLQKFKMKQRFREEPSFKQRMKRPSKHRLTNLIRGKFTGGKTLRVER